MNEDEKSMKMEGHTIKNASAEDANPSGVIKDAYDP